MASFPTQLPDLNRRTRIAPVWHTVVFLIVVIGLAIVQGHQQPSLENAHLSSRLPLYGAMIAFELALFLYVWLGLKLAGTRVREVIGGKWATVADVARDIGIALLFWLIVAGVLLTLREISGREHDGVGRGEGVCCRKDRWRLAVWIVLCTTAGILRGVYLPRLLAEAIAGADRAGGYGDCVSGDRVRVGAHVSGREGRDYDQHLRGDVRRCWRP
jgi:hypothetical protein